MSQHPDLLAFLLQLSIDTYIDELAFADWWRLNLNDLHLRYNASDEPDSSPAEFTFGIWARGQFRARKVAA